MRPSPETKSRAISAVIDDGQTAAETAAEFGLSASTIRRWVRAARRHRREQEWMAQTAGPFGFLSDYGFAPAGASAHHWSEILAIYRAERAAVLVAFSAQNRMAEVRLIRSSYLDLPTLAADRVFLIGLPGLNGHPASTLLTKPYPDRDQRLKVLQQYRGLEPAQVVAALAFWASVIQAHAADFLRGDLSILDDWERGKQLPAVIVHVPRSFERGQEAAAVARVRAVLPDAELVVKRYPISEDHSLFGS